LPRIRPFKGVIYNPGKIKNLSKVVAPPYDIIPRDMQDRLYRASPYNIVRLELNRITPSDDAKDNRYTRAGRFFDSWLKKRIMVRDGKESIYVYSQKYKALGKSVERIGFIALMEIEAKGGKKVLPHENTLAAPKTDRLSLMREVKANLSPIFVLYEDSQHEILKILKKACAKGKPFADVMFEGVRNRAWRIGDRLDIKKITRLMAGKDTFIADGHHRFEVSRMYSNEVSGESSKYVMVYFVETSENMLTVLPAHRLVIDIGDLTKEEIKSRLAKHFRVEKIPSLKAVVSKLDRLQSSHVFGMYLGKGEFHVLTLKDMKAVDEAIKDKSSYWKRLDVSILHLFIFQHALGIRDDDDNIEFVKSPQETAELVDKRKFKAAFFLNPTKVAEVKRIARLGEKMPRKATYFYPKPISGVVINKH